MNEIERYRRQVQKHALRSLGIDGTIIRGFVSEVQAVGQEAALLALPFGVPLPGEEQPPQDPATGALYFMTGVSDIDGPDAIQ